MVKPRKLTIYDIIKGPLVTDKALKLNRDFNKLVLRVHPGANKPLIKEALEKLFNVKVDNVRVMCCKGKKRMVKRKEVIGPMKKKAFVTLAKGHSLDLFDQSGKNIIKADKDENSSA